MGLLFIFHLCGVSFFNFMHFCTLLNPIQLALPFSFSLLLPLCEISRLSTH